MATLPDQVALNLALTTLAAVRTRDSQLATAPRVSGLIASSPFADLRLEYDRGFPTVHVKTQSGDTGTIEGSGAQVLAVQIEQIRAAARARQDLAFSQKIATLDQLIVSHFGVQSPAMRAGVDPRGENVGCVEVYGQNGLSEHSLVARKNVDGRKAGHVVSGHVDGVSFKIEPSSDPKVPGIQVAARGQVSFDRTVTMYVRGDAALAIFNAVSDAFKRNEKIRTELLPPA